MVSATYSKQHLLIALAKAGLPCSYTTLIKYERNGIIPAPNSPATFKKSKRVWRFYSEEEIEDIIAKVKKHKVSSGKRGQ